MEYTVLNLSKIAGVSTRTLRYYDGIGILKPARINSSGYRIYGEKEVNQLQQILLYRAMGVNLEMIGDIITSKTFDESAALSEHLTKLLAQRQQIDLLINNVENTIKDRKGKLKMNDNEKFNGFKKKLVEDNEKEYGKEIRAKYGEEVINESNQKMLNLTEEKYAEYEKLGQEVLASLDAAFATKDPAGALAQKTAELHRKWLSYTWKSYSGKAHAGLARMYVEDERFKAYYDKDQPGKAEFLRDAILFYTGETESELSWTS